jgi:protein-tyrosine phosphatase
VSPTDPAAEVLVVCTANRVRSPMGAAMLTRACAEAGARVRVSSAGLLRGGHPADPTAAAVAAEWGLDLDGHVSREIHRDLLRASDLVIVMTRDHLRQLAVLEPSAFSRTFTFPELARGVVDLPPSTAPLRERVAVLSAGRSARALLGERPQDDVADPMGGPVEGYRTLAAELAALVVPIATALAGRAAQAAPAPGPPDAVPVPSGLQGRPLPPGMPAPPSLRRS